MRVDAAPSTNLVENLQLQQQRFVLRALDGSNPANLQVGERINGSVVQTTAQGAVLNLKGNRILVDGLPEFVKPGSEIMVRVAGLFPEPVLEMETGNRPQTTMLTKGQPLLEVPGGPEAARAPLLELGQQVTAQVKEQLGGGRLLVEVNGNLLEAAVQGGIPEALARGDVRPGSSLQVRVEQVQPQVVLRILAQTPGVEGEAVEILRTNLAERVPVSQSLQALQLALNQLRAEGGLASLPPSAAKLQALVQNIFAGETPPTAEQLKNFISNGGFQFEAKLMQLADSSAGKAQLSEKLARLASENPQALARIVDRDVKGSILQVLNDLKTAPESAQSQTLSGPLVNHLNHIEVQQAINLLAQVHQEPYLLQFPYFNGQEFSTAFLSVEPDGQGDGNSGNGGKERGYNVLFQLDLERMGQTRIDTHLTSTTVRAIFYVEDNQALADLRAELPAFRQQLFAMGYQEVLLAANALGHLSPQKRQKFQALEAGIPKNVNLVDVRA